MGFLPDFVWGSNFALMSGCKITLTLNPSLFKRGAFLTVLRYLCSYPFVSLSY
jgi:hypothetical protein